MNKKIFTILFVAIFLIAAIGFVSASDSTKDISVSVNWDDNGNSVDRPGAVSVSLIENGKVVDRASLSASNSWHATFRNHDATGHYSIQVNGISGYSVYTSGNSASGFVITAQIIEEPVLNAENNEDIVGDGEDGTDPNNGGESQPTTGDDSQPTTGDDSQPATNGETTENNNDTGNDNSTNNETDNSTDDNKTNDDKTNDDKTNDDKTDDDKKTDNKSNTIKKVTTTVKKVIKKDKPVKKNNKTKLKDTGLPIALVLVAMGAIFIPIARKRK